MERKYVIYYRFSSTQSLSAEELKHQYDICTDGEILKIYHEKELGVHRFSTLQAAVNEAKTQQATLVIAELNPIVNHFCFYSFA